ncbi:ComEC/Rec2 family competence protein [Chryseobacterium oncorhynchi]|uniref:ComEC family competence protein n=1 Tax=Chryseobacterium oncorhynchi TaxID=741074 RepID=A0A316WW87_9FLAO|nr:ComEC/Rec2 family competence protein [Chryseobacterium oncorhynchi]PWN63398.1 ComEC family competence protein [Chryseobacterium oncorhynchi]
MNLNRQPLLILAICFILGIFFQDKILLEKNAVYGVGFISLSILISIFFQSYFLHKVRAILLGLLFFGIGIIIHFSNTFSTPVEVPVKKKETVTFKISQKLNSTEKYRKYEGEVQTGSMNFNAVLYLPKDSKELDFTHYYKSEAYITKPKPPQYDFQFDYARYLKRKNIEYQIYFSKEILSVERKDMSFTDHIKQHRLDVLREIDKAEMSGKTREFLKGIILADRTEMDANTVQDFNRSGLVHFLAISGTHIVVIFGIFYFLIVRFTPLQFRKYAVIVSLGFIWLFAAFIGFGNSVLRSCIMLSVYFIFVLLQRKPDLLHSLALSVFVILILDTQQLFDVGFQLSFAAVLGIFWLNQPLLKYFPRQDHYLKKLFFNTITISISAQLATLPLVLYYFHQFSFVSIIANFIIVPFSEVIIVFSFLMTTLVTLGINFIFIDKVYDFIIQILLRGIHWFAEVDLLFIKNIPMNLIEVLTVLVIVYLLRPMILKFNFKNSMKLTMAGLLFFMIRTGSDIFENQKEEILLHTFNKSKIVSLKKGNKVCFWIPYMTDQEKVSRFIVAPYCSSRRIDHFEIKIIPPAAQKIVFRDHIYEIK